MKSITHFIILFTLLFVPYSMLSTHIVGGTATYTSLGIEDGIASVEVYFYLYRDGNSPAQFDDNIELGIYGYANGEYEFIGTENGQLLTDFSLFNEDIGTCSVNLFSYLYGLYAFKVEIPVNDFEYFTLAYQRCCRDITITNLLSPSDTGIAISMDLYPIGMNNIDQVFSFKNEFPVQVNPGVKTNFDVAIGDSYQKEYYLTTPKSAGGSMGSSSDPGDPTHCEGIAPNPMNCLPEFDEVEYLDPDYPYGEGSVVEMDKNDGILSVTIPQTGKFLMGMTMERYIDGQIASRLRQQFVMNVIKCTTSLNDQDKASSFAVWPSPTNGELYLSDALEEISIYNIHGTKKVINLTNNFSNQINIDELTSGIYFMKGKTVEGDWVLKKIVKF